MILTVDKKIIGANSVLLLLLLLYLVISPTQSFLSQACPDGCRDLSGLALFGIWLVALSVHLVIGLPFVLISSVIAKRLLRLSTSVLQLTFSSFVAFFILLFTLLIALLFLMLAFALVKKFS